MYVVGISCFAPQFDSTPVLKTTYYPDGGSFRPLGYARIAVQRGKGVLFDLTAFERDPVVAKELLDGSCAALLLDVFPKTGKGALTAVFNAEGKNELYLCGYKGENAKKLGELLAETYSGGDEQGWYWGVRSCFSNELTSEVYGRAEIENGHTMRGNFYKFQRAGSFSHIGAAAKEPLEFPCVSYLEEKK